MGTSKDLARKGRYTNEGEIIMKIRIAALALVAALGLSACVSEADVASTNLSEAADNFEIERRIVFFNGITDTYMLEIIGLCSIEDEGNQLEVTCLLGPNDYRKHFLGLSDNVTYFVEQIEPGNVSGDRYRVRFRPQTIVPDFDLDLRSGDTVEELED